MSYLAEWYDDPITVIMDFETTSRHKGDYFGATPYDAKNHLVLAGLLDSPIPDPDLMWFSAHSKKGMPMMTLLARLETYIGLLSEGQKLLLVGVNIGFDLSYIMAKAPRWWALHRKHIIIWDCSCADYLMSGQLRKYPSMDSMAKALGLELKPDTLKSYMQLGVDIVDIPIDELTSYLKHDLTTTQAIYYSQRNAFKGVPPEAYLLKMEDTLMTTTMEANGMRFDSDLASSLSSDALTELTKLEDECGQYVTLVTGRMDINVNSTQQLATLLYGGNFKAIEDQPVMGTDGTPVVYKTGAKKGLVKTVKTEVLYPFTGLVPIKFEDRAVDEERLQNILTKSVGFPTVGTFITTLLQARSIRKDISTYYTGYSEYAELDGYLHSSLNQTGTGTGRLSSSKPNVQNCSHNGI